MADSEFEFIRSKLVTIVSLMTIKEVTPEYVADTILVMLRGEGCGFAYREQFGVLNFHPLAPLGEPVTI